MTKPLKQQHAPLLQVEDLCWRAGKHEILKRVSFAIEPGQFVGLLGPNGSGKSSLLRCLYKYIKPSSGRVLFNAQDLSDIPNKVYAQQVAVVLQHTPQQFHLSVKDVVALGTVPHSDWRFSASPEEGKKVDLALQQVGLLSKSEYDFEQLSGGEKQRVMIARAMVQSPQLLIMDEPTSHLDVKYQIQIVELAKSLGITVLASFHDLNLAASICDKVLMLKQGQLVADGSPEQVITENTLAEVFDVCTQVSVHPQKSVPLVTYYYGYLDTLQQEQTSIHKREGDDE